MFAISCFTAALVLANPAPQTGDLVEALIIDGDPVPGFPPNFSARVGNPRAGRGGGWILAVGVEDLPTPPTLVVLFGKRPGALDGPLELLRQPETLSGIEQGMFTSLSMANGTVAYSTRNSGGDQGAWIEDQLIAEAGQPVAGAQGWVWRTFSLVDITTTGQAYVFGIANDPMGDPETIIWRWPDEELLLTTGGPAAAATYSIHQYSLLPSFSPDGSQWTIAERTAAGSLRLVLNGLPYEVEPGYPVEEGQPVPPSIAGPNGPSTWTYSVQNLLINNRGDVAFRWTITDASGQESSPWIRNGRIIAPLAGSGLAIGIDARGALAIQRTVSNRLLDFEGVNALAQDFDIDLDGDGVADPIYDWGPFANEFMPPTPQGTTVFSGRFRPTPNFVRRGVFQARDMRMDAPVCDGALNSTGAPGQLVAGGSRKLADNELDLRLFGLPTGATGLVLLSRTAGFSSQPGGSQGDLCLGGSIGRDTQSIFTVGPSGRAQVTLNLNNLPQPTGSVAANAGERWYVQAWYRDSLQGSATSNFTSASALRFE